MTHFCYILYNDTNNATYNGYTNNFERRIRQHNGLIKGGAKVTTAQVNRNNVQWKPLVIVECVDLEDKRRALSLEWSIKYPDNKRPRSKCYNGPIGRVHGLVDALRNPKFADMRFIIHVYMEEAMPILEGAFEDSDRCKVIFNEEV